MCKRVTTKSGAISRVRWCCVCEECGSELEVAVGTNEREGHAPFHYSTEGTVGIVDLRARSLGQLILLLISMHRDRCWMLVRTWRTMLQFVRHGLIRVLQLVDGTVDGSDGCNRTFGHLVCDELRRESLLLVRAEKSKTNDLTLDVAAATRANGSHREVVERGSATGLE